jgi:hypothetical protein
LIRAFEGRAPGTARVAAERLTYRNFILVALVMDGANLFPDNWIYRSTHER